MAIDPRKPYHVGKNGPAFCPAKQRCRLGDVPHFATLEEGAAYQQALALRENNGSPLEAAQKRKTRRKDLDQLNLDETQERLSALHKKRLSAAREIKEAYDEIERINNPSGSRRGVIVYSTSSTPDEKRRKAALVERANRGWTVLQDTDEDLEKLQRRTEELTGNVAPERPGPPPQIMGLRDAQKALFVSQNLIGTTSNNDRKFFTQGDPEAYLDESLNRFHAGHVPHEIEGDTQGVTRSSRDKFLYALTDSSNHMVSTSATYATYVMPERELKEELERLELEDVWVSPLLNGREEGLVYTVLTPTGDSRSFSVYEHRNTDSLVINGQTNWDPIESPHGPYGGGQKRGKNDFFAEVASGDYKTTARTLGYFLKEAQAGRLEDDITLANNAEHRDWNAILSESIPGYSDWLKENERGSKPPRDILSEIEDRHARGEMD